MSVCLTYSLILNVFFVTFFCIYHKKVKLFAYKKLCLYFCITKQSIFVLTNLNYFIMVIFSDLKHKTLYEVFVIYPFSPAHNSCVVESARFRSYAGAVIFALMFSYIKGVEISITITTKIF